MQIKSTEALQVYKVFYAFVMINRIRAYSAENSSLIDFIAFCIEESKLHSAIKTIPSLIRR